MHEFRRNPDAWRKRAASAATIRNHFAATLTTGPHTKQPLAGKDKLGTPASASVSQQPEANDGAPLPHEGEAGVSQTKRKKRRKLPTAAPADTHLDGAEHDAAAGVAEQHLAGVSSQPKGEQGEAAAGIGTSNVVVDSKQKQKRKKRKADAAVPPPDPFQGQATVNKLGTKPDALLHLKQLLVGTQLKAKA